MALVSIVVPCCDEAECIVAFHTESASAVARLADVELEFVFVDDGSTDGTLDIIKKLRSEDPRVRFVSFSRNFGKEAAILAGLRHARGDYVVLMDADLQDPPGMLPDMYAAVAQQGWDCAAARRMSRRGESPIRSLFARMFYKVFNMCSRTELVDGARDFRLMTRQMVDAVLGLAEVNRFSKGIFSWVGFRTTWLPYEGAPRSGGRTKWSFLDLLRYSIEGIVDFSTVPLALSAVVGVVFCLAAFAGVVIIVVKRLTFGDPVQGWASLTCIVLFAAGVQSLMIAILGEYLSRTYLETKRRPPYIVRATED